MEQLCFEWDDDKDAANQRKHDVSFAEARTVFSDEFARLIADPDHSEDEDRFVLLGMSGRARLLVVCHCVRDEDSIRIISARQANRPERDAYEGYYNARKL
ncbi:MAG: BrnT family toxin [Gammaproteobacteria bacterium]|nr:BrnT family toxin [Gammaproteobacteria bacterium]